MVRITVLGKAVSVGDDVTLFFTRGRGGSYIARSEEGVVFIIEKDHYINHILNKSGIDYMPMTVRVKKILVRNVGDSERACVIVTPLHPETIVEVIKFIRGD